MLVSLIFLKISLVFPILLFSSISLHWSLRKAFLSLLAILWNSAFGCLYLSFSPLLCASLLFTAICKASPDSHFAFCISFPWGWSWSAILQYKIKSLKNKKQLLEAADDQIQIHFFRSTLLWKTKKHPLEKRPVLSTCQELLNTCQPLQWLEVLLPMQPVQFQSLVKELRYYMPQGQKTPKHKQYCNKFNKNFKNGPHQKIVII